LLREKIAHFWIGHVRALLETNPKFEWFNDKNKTDSFALVLVLSAAVRVIVIAIFGVRYRGVVVSDFEFWSFGFVSIFGFRYSNFIL